MEKKILSLVLIMVLSSTLMTGCVKIVKIGEEGKITGKTEFNAGDSVSEMWESAVADIEGKAVDLPEFLKEANGDMDSLADKYGKYSMGTTGTVSYAVKGLGVIEEVHQEKKAGYMTVKLDNYDGTEVIKLQIGTVYKGSSTRDSLDIINFGDFTNQEEWAAISQQLHSMIDKNVIQPADPAALQGKSVTFIGTFTADNDAELLITPVSLTVQ